MFIVWKDIFNCPDGLLDEVTVIPQDCLDMCVGGEGAHCSAIVSGKSYLHTVHGVSMPSVL